jgi:hypothetical protein
MSCRSGGEGRVAPSRRLTPPSRPRPPPPRPPRLPPTSRKIDLWSSLFDRSLASSRPACHQHLALAPRRQNGSWSLIPSNCILEPSAITIGRTLRCHLSTSVGGLIFTRIGVARPPPKSARKLTALYRRAYGLTRIIQGYAVRDARRPVSLRRRFQAFDAAATIAL